MPFWCVRCTICLRFNLILTTINLRQSHDVSNLSNGGVHKWRHGHRLEEFKDFVKTVGKCWKMRKITRLSKLKLNCDPRETQFWGGDILWAKVELNENFESSVSNSSTNFLVLLWFLKFLSISSKSGMLLKSSPYPKCLKKFFSLVRNVICSSSE